MKLKIMAKIAYILCKQINFSLSFHGNFFGWIWRKVPAAIDKAPTIDERERLRGVRAEIKFTDKLTERLKVDRRTMTSCRILEGRGR